MAYFVDHPLIHQELRQLCQAPGRKGQAPIDGVAERDFLDLPSFGQVNIGGRPPAYLGTNESKPSSLKLWSTARTRLGAVNATWAIWATSIPWADSNTIWARRHVTTDPEDRRTIRNRRLPSSFADFSNAYPVAHVTSSSGTVKFCGTRRSEWWTRPSNVAGHGTSNASQYLGLRLDREWANESLGYDRL